MIKSLLERLRRRVPSHADFLPDPEEIERTPVPFAAHAAVLLLAALVAIAIAWASFAEIDMIVVARGRLITPQANIVVQPLETAVVQSVDVRVGQIVKKGQALVSLDPTFVAADAAQLRARLESLDSQVQRLESELQGGRAPVPAGASADARLQSSLQHEKLENYRQRLLRLDEAIGRAKAGIVTNARDQQVLGSRVRSLAEIEAMQEKLHAQNYGARLKLLEAREKRQEVERDLEQAVNRAAELRRELALAEAERAAFIKEWRQKAMEELVTVRRDRDAVAEQLQKAERRSALVVLTAPADAVVLDVAKRSIGSVAREAEPLVTLVPLNTELEAEVQIETDDVGYVKTGDPVRIKFDAYPFQRHGTIEGKLRTVSEDSFQRERGAAIGRSDLFYLGRVKVGQMKLKRVPAETRLVPGMTLTAEIAVGRQRVISYFAYPLIKGFDEAIREPAPRG